MKNGVSALALRSILGLGSYRTAWALLHKLPRTMLTARLENGSATRVDIRRDLCGVRRRRTALGRQTQKKALWSHRRR